MPSVKFPSRPHSSSWMNSDNGGVTLRTVSYAGEILGLNVAVSNIYFRSALEGSCLEFHQLG